MDKTKWIEYEDCYAVEILGVPIQPDSEFEVDLGSGIIASFGEPKSKLHSKQYKLIEVSFDKAEWRYQWAMDWFMDHRVFYVDARKQGKKVLEPDFIIGSPSNLIEGGYIFVSNPGAKRFAVKKCIESCDIPYSDEDEKEYEIYRQLEEDKP